MRPRRRHRRDPRRVGIPPVTIRWAAVRLDVSLLHLRRAFEAPRLHCGPGALRRAADRWSYARGDINRAWHAYVDGALHEAERRSR